MEHIWKEVLCRGSQRDRFGRWFSVTPRTIADAHRNAKTMFARGVPLPLCWEHQDGIEASSTPTRGEAAALAEWKRKYAKYCFGHAGDVRLNHRGNLELRHDVPDPADAKQLLKVKFCSPKLYPSYSDSRGGEYAGTTIAHVAATPTPVQSWQLPYELSRTGALYLSYSPEGSTVPDETPDDKGKGKGKESKDERGELGKLIDALREKGLNIPDEVKDLSGLIIAVKASPECGAKDDLGPEPAPAEDGTMPPTDTAGAPGGSAPMLMSATQAEKFAGLARKDLKARIKDLFTTGRIDRPTAQNLLRRSEAVSLSFTTAGDMVHNEVASQVAAYEQLPKGMTFTAKGGKAAARGLELSTTAVDEPAEMSREEKAAAEVIATQTEFAKQFSPAAKV